MVGVAIAGVVVFVVDGSVTVVVLTDDYIVSISVVCAIAISLESSAPAAGLMVSMTTEEAVGVGFVLFFVVEVVLVVLVVVIFFVAVVAVE